MVVEPENVQAHPQRTHAQWLLTNRMMMRMRGIPGISFHPPFTRACPPGIQFEQPLLRGRMHTAIVFFTEELVNDIVKHTNSYAVHRSGIRQYIKDKQINRGIKLWVLADSSNGCTVDFKIYIGKDSAREISKFGLGHDVKVRLISLYFNQCSLNMCNTSLICYFPTNFYGDVAHITRNLLS